MRIVAVTPTFFPIVGGAELLIRDVLNVWSEQHEVRLLTPHLCRESQPFWIDDADRDSECRFPVRRFDDRVNLLRLRGHRATKGLIPPTSLTAIGEIEREARDIHADALVGFFGVPYGLSLAAASARLGVPYLLVICGTDLPSPRTQPVPMWRYYLRYVTDHAARVAYVSRFCFDVLHARQITPPHDSVIHGGISMAWPAEDGDPQALRRSLGIGPDDIMLFSLQRLGPEKRVDVVVRAFAMLPPLTRRVRLVIGGQGSEMAPLKRLAEELGVTDRITFTGHLGPEKDLYYRASDVFVFHSLFETFGQVLIEAMRAGKPIVSVRAGAIPEVVAEGETGLLALPEDPQGLARAIAQIVDDEMLRKSLGAAARERAEHLFDWKCVRTQWEELLDVQTQRAEVPSAIESAALRAEGE